jgi:hypothetical protein
MQISGDSQVFARLPLAGGKEIRYIRHKPCNEGECRKKDALTPSQERAVEQLKRIDAQVREHEGKHQAAADGHASEATYIYQRGPDGKYYAVGGRVNLDARPVSGDIEATRRKLESVRRAALAPSDPSAQDSAVALQVSSQLRHAELKQAFEQSEQNERRDAWLRGETGSIVDIAA